MADPNFPPNLNIKPLGSSDVTDDQQRDAIVTYGIAGRVCDKFDPPCSLFVQEEKKRVIELGSGQSVASLHLAKRLGKNDLIVLTDLPEVVPLCEQAVQRNDTFCKVIAQPLAWGEDASHLRQFAPFTHVLMCDLTTPVRGGDWEAKVFICRRWKVTDEWTLPGVKDVMNGGKGVIRGRSFGLVDDLFGSLEWEV
ncbi:hypothetical protein IAT40_007667 [Kwoniella sp. CBS 6097]